MQNNRMDHCQPNRETMNFEEDEIDENLNPQVVLQSQEERGFDESLIDAVEGYSHLHEAVADRGDYDQLKAEIRSNRLTRLRESYSKKKKKRQIENNSGNGAARQRGFIDFEGMRFIDKFVKTRCSVSNIKLTQPFDSSHYSQCEDRNEAILKWIQQSDFTSQTQSSSSQQSIVNVSGSTTNRPTPYTTPKVMNFEDASSTSSLSTDFNMNNDFENRSLSMSSKSPPLTKPSTHVKGRFNPYVKLKKYDRKKEAENDEFETSFINLNKAVTAHFENKTKSQQTSNDEDDSFQNLIVAKLKGMNEEKKLEIKRQMLKILWQNSSPKKD